MHCTGRPLGSLTGSVPIDVSRIASQIEKTITQPKRRRFTRYAQQLAVHTEGASRPSTAVVIGRGGMMIRTDEDLSVSSIQSCNLSLPATGARLEFEAEVVYRVRESGHRGIGLRFQSISEQHEAALIDYFYCLHEQAAEEPADHFGVTEYHRA
ncbi:MAG: PilZ domain-containing protein [Myxococcota bacterium]|nr:PilZ domain-containing protein [Myxococcota bacterium]